MTMNCSSRFFSPFSTFGLLLGRDSRLDFFIGSIFWWLRDHLHAFGGSLSLSKILTSTSVESGPFNILSSLMTADTVISIPMR